MTTLSCLGQKFGHDFPYPGARCARCQVLQTVLSGEVKVAQDLKIKPTLKPANHYLHSPAHLLADEISHAFGEPKKFAMYLGVIKRVGVERSRQVFTEILRSDQPLASKRRLFMWQCRNSS